MIRLQAASALRALADRVSAPADPYTRAALVTSGGVVVSPWHDAEWRLGLVVFAFWWSRAGLSWRELSRQQGVQWRTAYDLCSGWMGQAGVVIMRRNKPAVWAYWISDDGQQYGEWDYPRFRRYVRLDRFALPYPAVDVPAALKPALAHGTHSTQARWQAALRGGVQV